MQLDPQKLRLASYLYVQDVLAGRVVEIGGDERTRALLERLVGRRGTVEQVSDASGLAEAQADVVVAVGIAPETVDRTVVDARRALKPEGVLVIGTDSKDRPGAQRGVSYYDLIDRLEGRFASITMVGQAPFAGATLVEYGAKDPEPLLDGTLVDKGERVAWYLAIGAPRRAAAGGYAVVQLPVTEIGWAPPAQAAAGVAPTVAQTVAQTSTAPQKTVAPAAAPAVAPAAAPPVAPAPPAVERPGAVAPRAASARPGAKAEPLSAADAAELAERFRQREQAIEEARTAALRHAEEMEKVKQALRERDAYIAELELDSRLREQLRTSASRAESRAQNAEAEERKARLRLAQLEGQLLRIGSPGPSVSAPPRVTTPALSPSGEPVGAAGEPNARVRELEAENERLRQKEADSRAESWKHLKARSEAEAQAAEVREDTVRKLKDARKLASVELMRAMEEATRKAVSLRDELQRSEKERKEQKAELQALKAAAERGAPGSTPVDDLERARAREEAEAMAHAARAQAERSVREEGAARAAAESAGRVAEARLDDLRGQLVGLERELVEAERVAENERERAAELGELVRRLEAELNAQRQAVASGQAAHGSALEAAQAERERMGRMLAEVEHDAKARAETAVRMRAQLKEREREVEALRREVAERDQKLIALERLHPPQAEVERMEAELQAARVRLSELTLELQRREAATERAAAAAAHERARAERQVAEERRAVGERNEARARLADAEARVGALKNELERSHRELELEAERARKAESEARERKERVKQLKRDLEGAERRVAEAEPLVQATRERLDGMESTLKLEVERMAAMEEALRRAAAQLDGPV